MIKRKSFYTSHEDFHHPCTIVRSSSSTRGLDRYVALHATIFTGHLHNIGFLYQAITLSSHQHPPFLGDFPSHQPRFFGEYFSMARVSCYFYPFYIFPILPPRGLRHLYLPALFCHLYSPYISIHLSPVCQRPSSQSFADFLRCSKLFLQRDPLEGSNDNQLCTVGFTRALHRLL